MVWFVVERSMVKVRVMLGIKVRVMINSNTAWVQLHQPTMITRRHWLVGVVQWKNVGL